MDNRIAGSLRCFIVCLAPAVMMACNSRPDPRLGTEAGQSVQHSARLLKKYEESERSAVRVKRDTVRGRVWMLGIDNQVLVYDEPSKRLLRQITLPGWLAFKMTPCMPDLIVDRSGFAFISSNVKPWIWQVDPVSFRRWVHVVTMPGKDGFDFGFGALALSAKGNLYGLSPSGDSLWSIDLARASAVRIESYRPPLRQCSLEQQTLDHIETPI